MTSLLAALGIVFLAELGDKTQLVALGFGARHPLPPVMFGLVLGYAATNTLSVAAGGLIGTVVPRDAVSIGGGLAFMGFALWTLRAGPDDPDPEVPASSRRIVWSVAGAIVVAEMGDKTMLATATLAARSNPVAVWIGATTGIVLAAGVGVLVGRVLGARLPERVVRLGSAALFGVFGLALILSAVP